MTCAHCAEMARQAASLKDEVENWRAWGRPTPMAVEAERVAIWQRVFDIAPGPMRVLLRLVDGRGSSVGFDALIQRPGMGDVDASAIAKVYVWRVRKALSEAGVTVDVVAVRNHGYMIERAPGERLLALVEGAGDA
jgi:hypothetical protein